VASARDTLSEEEVGRARDAIAVWRKDSHASLTCPRCGFSGLVLSDCSARPYAEWYQLKCSNCGLNAMLNIPMAPPPG
jgi:transcription elongation factor Elf1